MDANPLPPPRPVSRKPFFCLKEMAAPPPPPPFLMLKKDFISLVPYFTRYSCKRDLELESVKGEGGSIPVKSLKTELEEKHIKCESKGEEMTIEEEWNAWMKDYQQLSSDGVMTQQLHAKLKRLMLQFIQEPMHHKYLVEAYEKVPIARNSKLTGSGQTSLHLLAQNGSESVIVEQVLAFIDADILKMKDDDGNTALHIAAEGDKLKMCGMILSRSTDLIKEPNKKGETPSSILTRGMVQFAEAEKWGSVVTAYKQICAAVGDASRLPLQTPIHVAVKMGNAERAKQMLEDGYEEALKIKDENGDTALHLAVANIGMKDLCRIIVGKSPQLVNVRNDKGQTPLFLSALNGNTSIYSYLRPSAYRNVIIATTDNGNTALHCAISYEHFDTAYHMLHSYPCDDYEGLLFIPNKDGETPLTILANKPYVFKSGTPLTLIERIIYSCIHVSTLEKVSSDERKHSKESSWLKKIFLAEKCRLGDVESPDNASGTPEGGNQVPQSKFRRHLQHYCASFLIWLLPANVVEKMKKVKRRHLLVHGIMEKLVENETLKEYVGPLKQETRLLIAARMGVTEMVKEIVMRDPKTFEDKRLNDGRNVVHMAIQSRQADVFELLVNLEEKGIVKWKDAMITDKNGNNALHLAAVRTSRRPWGLRETLQLHWEIKWYNYVRDSVPEDFSRTRNKEKKTPPEVFREEHKHLHQNQSNFEGEWLNMTSRACSLVAVLIATVAFSSATTIPGGNRAEDGFPIFQGHPALTTFTISSFVALCFSLISLIMFLTILISPNEDYDDVGKSLLEELIVGLTTLLLSIGAMMVAFCAGHYFHLIGTIKYVAIPLYLMGCLSISYFFFTKFYSSFLLHFSKRKPGPCYSEHY